MSTAHLGLDSFAHLIWPFLTNLFCDSHTILNRFQYCFMYMFSHAARICDLMAVLVGDLPLSKLLHLVAVGRRNVAAVFHGHHLRLLLFNYLTFLLWFLDAAFLLHSSCHIDLILRTHFVLAPWSGLPCMPPVTFHLGDSLADVQDKWFFQNCQLKYVAWKIPLVEYCM